MPAEMVPASTQSDGRTRINYVPLASNALSIAVLNGASSKPVTYSLTADGFNYGVTQARVEDKRLTLTTDLSRPGRKSESLTIKYVDSTTVDSAAVLFVEGLTGKLTIRRGVDNAVNHIVGQLVDVITFIAGAQIPDPPTENGLDTVSQELYVTDVTVRKQPLVA